MGEFTNGRDYTVYAEGMDVGFMQKWDDLSPFLDSLPYGGTFVDVGCGTGKFLAFLATVRPDADLIGIEPSPKMRKIAVRNVAAYDNVSVREGMADALPLEHAVADVVMYSSVFHEIYSYGGYDRIKVENALREANRVVKHGGVVAIRDGVAPERREQAVRLRFHTETDELTFYRFAEDFRPNSDTPGVRWTAVPNSKDVIVRLHDAAEFLSKKDYHENWKQEVNEEFGVNTPNEWDRLLTRCGFEVTQMDAYRHPWVLENRYINKVSLLDVHDPSRQLPYPSTTVVVHATKVASRELKGTN